MKAFILAAGKGTRLKHLTADLPKPMLPVGSTPLLEHLIRWLRCHAITDIVINLHHAPEIITTYLADGSRFGVSIYYSYEESLLGTAGAVKRQQLFLDQTFVVIYGDVFTNFDLTRLIRFHHAQMARHAAQAALTLALYQVPNPTECGLVGLDASGRVQRFIEKPPSDQVFTNLANAGFIVCEPAILEAIPLETVFDYGRDLFPKLMEGEVPLFGQEIETDEFVIDIGTVAGYQRAQDAFQRENAYQVSGGARWE
jgi:mannose-1-phosphate guanylyltransferase/phosphomannomutase